MDGGKFPPQRCRVAMLGSAIGLPNLLSKLRHPGRLASLSVVGARCLQAPAGAMKRQGTNLKVLVLGDGCAGAENQSLGLVHHIDRLSLSHGWSNVECSLRHILPTRAFKFLPAAAHIALARFVPGIGMMDFDQGEHRWLPMPSHPCTVHLSPHRSSHVNVSPPPIPRPPCLLSSLSPSLSPSCHSDGASVAMSYHGSLLSWSELFNSKSPFAALQAFRFPTFLAATHYREEAASRTL